MRSRRPRSGGLPQTLAQAPAAHAPLPERLGRYAVVGRLGAGGMGEVLRVRDEDLGREVAAKLVRPPVDAGQLAKFVLEAQVTGQLEHPNIVPLYELARAGDGSYFFTMKRVEGRTLQHVLDEADRPVLSTLLGIFLKICDAVAYAHARGVIHRDLKPANVMVGEFGEVLVLDWGLAKVLGQAAAVCPDVARFAAPQDTLDGAVAGTPAYMPPEQAQGQIDRLDARSDVFALGAILYQILTGVPPFSGATVWAVLDQAQEARLVPPRTRAPERDIPWELEAVVLKAMMPQPAKRYARVRALQADVEAFLGGRLVSGARYSVGQRVGKWLRRHRWLAGAALAVVLVGGGSAGAVHLDARRRLEEQRRESREAEQQRRDQVVAAALAEAAGAARGLPDRTALHAELEAWRALPARDAAARSRADAQARVPRYLAAAAALDRAARTAPLDDALRLRRVEAGETLGLAALLAGDHALAHQAWADLAGWGMDAERVESRQREVRDDRERLLRWRRQSLDLMVSDLGEGLSSAKRHYSDWALDDYVLEAAGFADQQTALRLAEGLQPLVQRARRDGRAARWTEADRDLARFCCRVLGRLGLAECIPPLADWLGASRGTARASWRS